MELLDLFGRSVISARDNTIESNHLMIDGKMKGPYANLIKPKLQEMSHKDKEFIKQIMTSVVDEAMHNFLYRLQSSGLGYTIGIKTNSGQDDFLDIVELSDGLHGELFTEDGWIAKYGKYPSVYNDI